MQITIEIEPKTFSLLQKVQERGVLLDDVLREALSKIDSKKHSQESVPADVWIKSLKKWANKKRDLPDISDEMLRRENLYEDRI